MNFFLKSTVFLALLGTLFVTHVHAKSQGFVQNQLQDLETQIHKEFKIEQVAQYLAEIRTYKNWPETLDQNLRLYIGITWFDQNHIVEGSAVLLAIKKQENYRDLLLYYRSLALIYSGKAPQATNMIAEMEGKFKNDFDVLYIKSIYMAELGDYIGAIEVLDKVAKRHKRVGKVFLQRGLMYMLSLNNDAAIEDFKQAVRYLPEHELYKRQQAYLQMGLIYLRIKLDKVKAAEFLKKGVAIDPQSTLVQQVKASIR